MTEAAAVRIHRLDLVRTVLSSVMGVFQAQAPSGDSASLGAADLPVVRLRDLGFEADGLGESIDFAKGQHHRFL